MPSWIKLRDDLESDPRVHRMAAHIAQTAPGYILTSAAKDLFGSVTHNVTRNALRDVTVMGLSRVWFAANQHTTDGIFHHADLSYLDDLARIPGFGDAMSAVGYAIHDPEAQSVTLPRFEEYNSPDKNGHRAKTAGALRAQRLRDRRKNALQTLSADSAPPPPVRDDVTPPVTDRNVTNNATPSISYSSSISESESESDSDSQQPAASRQPPADPDPITTLKRRINALRPSWTKTPHWSAEEESALYEARHNLTALDDQDWHLLSWFFRWANSAQNTGQREPVKVSARRAHLCHDLAALLDRATTAWKQAGAPRLGPPISKSQSLKVSKSPAPPEPPAPNENVFLGLLKANGGQLPPNVATQPQPPTCPRPTPASPPISSPAMTTAP
jgi:hypothetical protein